MFDQIKFPPLNFAPIEAKVRRTNAMLQIHDKIRRKYVSLTPEEWVRQHLVLHLIRSFTVPASLITLESQIKYASLNKRPDVLVYNRQGEHWLLAECKAPDVSLNENTWMQTFTYASVLKPQYIAVTNGLHHIICEFRPKVGNYVLIPDFPQFPSL